MTLIHLTSSSKRLESLIFVRPEVALTGVGITGFVRTLGNPMGPNEAPCVLGCRPTRLADGLTRGVMSGGKGVKRQSCYIRSKQSRHRSAFTATRRSGSRPHPPSRSPLLDPRTLYCPDGIVFVQPNQRV